MFSAASSYARAFADVALNAHLDASQALKELKEISGLLSESPNLRRVWESPAISAVQKRALLDAIASCSAISRPVRNLVAVLIDHRRAQYLDVVAQQLEKELNVRMGFAEAEVFSARELNVSERQTLEAQVAKLTGRKVKARYEQDASLLGGAVVRVGSTIYDGSVKGRLEKIRQAIRS